MQSGRENIALIGFMGSGKSSIGRMLARKLGWDFADTDHLIVQRDGREISEIFATNGEAFFREQEHAAIESLRDSGRHIIATGGGIVTQPENVTLLREMSFVVWLTATEEVIFERVSRNTNRPLLQTPNPRETIAALHALRLPLYESAAHFAIDTSTRSHAEIADEIIAAAQRHYGVADM